MLPCDFVIFEFTATQIWIPPPHSIQKACYSVHIFSHLSKFTLSSLIVYTIFCLYKFLYFVTYLRNVNMVTFSLQHSKSLTSIIFINMFIRKYITLCENHNEMTGVGFLEYCMKLHNNCLYLFLVHIQWFIHSTCYWNECNWIINAFILKFVLCYNSAIYENFLDFSVCVKYLRFTVLFFSCIHSC